MNWNNIETIEFLRKIENAKHTRAVQNNNYCGHCISKGGQKRGQKKRVELLPVCSRNLEKQNKPTAYT